MKNDPQPSIFRQESLERLSSPEQLDQLMQVVNSKSWLSLAALGTLVGLVLVWSIFGRIPVAIAGRGVLVYPSDSSDELVGLTYFDSATASRIQPGMEIVIVPDRVGTDAMGGMLGRVKTVSDSPLMTLDAARQASTTNLQSEAIEVVIELEPDASTVSGYRWSSPAGQRIEVAPGMTATARITLDQKAPIAFAFPFLEVAQ